MIKEQNNENKNNTQKELLYGTLVHFLYSFCLENNISMRLFKKGREQLKEWLNNFLEDEGVNNNE